MSYTTTPEGLIRFQFARCTAILEPSELRQLLSNALLQSRLKGVLHRVAGVGTPARPDALEADKAAEVLHPTAL